MCRSGAMGRQFGVHVCGTWQTMFATNAHTVAVANLAYPVFFLARSNAQVVRLRVAPAAAPFGRVQQAETETQQTQWPTCARTRTRTYTY